MKFLRNKKSTSENDVIVSKDTSDFRYIEPKEYPAAEFGDISRESDAEMVKISNVDDRTPDYRFPLIDVYTDYNKAVIDEHFTKSVRMWQVIKSGAHAQLCRVQADLEFAEFIESILNLKRRNNNE